MAACRAAIVADSGYADAPFKLGILLETRAKQIEESGGDLTKAAALHGECTKLWGFGKGTEHEWTKAAQANEARLRRRL